MGSPLPYCFVAFLECHMLWLAGRYLLPKDRGSTSPPGGALPLCGSGWGQNSPPQPCTWPSSITLSLSITGTASVPAYLCLCPSLCDQNSQVASQRPHPAFSPCVQNCVPDYPYKRLWRSNIPAAKGMVVSSPRGVLLGVPALDIVPDSFALLPWCHAWCAHPKPEQHAGIRPG